MLVYWGGSQPTLTHLLLPPILRLLPTTNKPIAMGKEEKKNKRLWRKVGRIQKSDTQTTILEAPPALASRRDFSVGVWRGGSSKKLQGKEKKTHKILNTFKSDIHSPPQSSPSSCLSPEVRYKFSLQLSSSSYFRSLCSQNSKTILKPPHRSPSCHPGLS